MKSQLIAAVLLGTVCLGCLGCGGGARRVSISAWQDNVEQYVKEQGKGDPAVLRDVTISDSRRGFAMLGSDRPAESTDATGVLLGFREINGRSYFIYLVGVVEGQRVQELRLAALGTSDGRLRWKLGAHDRAALSAYQSYYEKLWKQRFPNRGSPPPQYLGFPKPEDNFQLDVPGNRIRVVHTRSGAQWELTLPPPPKP